MSSIKFDNDISGEEVRNMTMQWGYSPAPVSRQSEDTIADNETLSAVFKALNPVINFFSMIAGAATAVAILSGIATYFKLISW